MASYCAFHFGDVSREDQSAHGLVFAQKPPTDVRYVTVLVDLDARIAGLAPAAPARQ